MSRRMLINAREPQELRVAIVENSTLQSYQVEVAESDLTRGNIYRATVANVNPSLNAAFIEYGVGKHGFLSVQDVVPEAYHKQPPGKGRPAINEVLEKGRPLLVQVEREAVGDKGAVLTTDISIAGRYLVLTPFGETRGVSRKVDKDETRKRLKELAGSLDLPAGCGVIVRTNALDQTKRDLNRDLSALMRLWKRVVKDSRQGKRPALLYSDQNVILRALRDYLESDVREILVDDESALEQVRQYLKAFLPRTKIKVQHYDDRTPLFSRYSVEAQIARIYDRRVELPSGGSIVIDATEALVAIDVNSGRASGGSGEETALKTNIEAAEAVARQLRLRDIGGLVVVDFIDMRSAKNRRRIESDLKNHFKIDKARVYIGRISTNGLLEINRQRIQQELRLRTQRPCPTCDGTGRIPSVEILSLGLLRRLRATANEGHYSGVRLRLHPETAAEFQNSRRHELIVFEQEYGLHVDVVPSQRLHRPESEFEWIEGTPSVEPRAESRPAPEPPDQPAERPRRSGTRRRRGGRGKAAKPGAEEPTARQADKSEKTEEPKRSRRGGSRRRRGGRRAAGDASSNGSGDAVAAGAATPAAAGSDAGSDAGSEEKPPPKRRRRRRRRRKPAGSDAPSQPN